MGASAVKFQATSEVLEGGKYVHEKFSRPRGGPKYFTQLNEAYQLFGRAMGGSKRAMLDLVEAFSTDDFPFLFGDILSRELLPQYQVAPAIWPQFTRRTVTRDFRNHKLVDLLGGQGILDAVPELSEYKARDLDEAEYELRVRKYGARFALSWESLVNDDLGGLDGLPNRLAVSARRTEDHHATSMFVGAAGPLTTFWQNYGTFDNRATAAVMGNDSAGNPIGDNPDLTVDSLDAAITAIMSRLDEDGAPVMVDGLILVVPPALTNVAARILEARELRISEGSNVEIIVGNYLSGQVEPVTNPWLPVIDQSGNSSTTWYLLPVPSSPRPALAMGFLRGNETPDLRLKSSDSQRVGGGLMAPEDGSFDNDDIQYRVRHVMGGATVDPFATLASQGTGDPWA
jgi:hypothetical protein